MEGAFLLLAILVIFGLDFCGSVSEGFANRFAEGFTILRSYAATGQSRMVVKVKTP
jgi:hypothetical protein